ncbi:unnamed protein product [Moneuplotes crassus]|uniref:Uncharacterized protein n=1 Tax=Euplotes crassus TaxID=5936 RepID=A0AAD1Y575_EUPCR|nr:unnamed protein product [Moneuplotes crassus]
MIKEVKEDFLVTNENVSIMQAEDYLYRNFSANHSFSSIDPKEWFENMIRHFEEIRAHATGDEIRARTTQDKTNKAKYAFNKLLSHYQKSKFHSKKSRKRGGSADREIHRNFPKIFGTPNKFKFYNPLAEQKAYTNHMHRLRRAHQIELRNVKMKFICLIDEIVDKKLSAIQQAIDSEFSKFMFENHVNKNKIRLLSKELDKLRKVISNYEVMITHKTIQDLQPSRLSLEMEAAQMIKQATHKRKSSSKCSRCYRDSVVVIKPEQKSLVKRNSRFKGVEKDFSLNEFKKGFNTFMELMSSKLKELNQQKVTSSQECQAIDYEAIQKEKEWKELKQKLENKIITLKEGLKSQTESFAKKYQEQAQIHDSKEKNYLARIKHFEKKSEKLYQEIIQVKKILRSPYLYSKYRKAKFDEFPDLNIAKFKPVKTNKKRKKELNMSLSMEKVDSLDENSQFENMSCRTADRLNRVCEIGSRRRLRASMQRPRSKRIRLRNLDFNIADINIKRSRKQMEILRKDNVFQKVRLNKNKQNKRLTQSQSNNSKSQSMKRRLRPTTMRLRRKIGPDKYSSLPDTIRTEGDLSEGRKRTIVFKNYHPTCKGKEDPGTTSENEIVHTNLVIMAKGKRGKSRKGTAPAKKPSKSRRYKEGATVYGAPSKTGRHERNSPQKLTKSLSFFQVGDTNFFASKKSKKYAKLKQLCKNRLRSQSECSYSQNRNSDENQRLYNNHDVYK